MKNQEDEIWQGLLLRATPTFAGETEPPFGFITSTLNRLRSEDRQVAEIERIGWRALLASVAALAVAATITITVNFSQPGSDFEPGMKTLVQVENIQVS